MSRPCRLVVAGSRSIGRYDLVAGAIEQTLRQLGWSITEVEIVSGNAEGVDRLGEQWAKEHRCPVTRFFPDWRTYGKSAGPMRNREMAEYADGAPRAGAVLTVWDGRSRGTQSMIHLGQQLFLPVFVHELVVLRPDDPTEEVPAPTGRVKLGA